MTKQRTTGATNPTAKPTLNPVATEQLRRMTMLAGTLMRSGAGDAQIMAELQSQGMKPETALTIVRTLRAGRTKIMRRRSRRDVWLGALVALISGLIAALLLTSIIRDPSGNGAIIALGGVVFGVALLWRGWSVGNALRAEADRPPAAS